MNKLAELIKKQKESGAPAKQELEAKDDKRTETKPGLRVGGGLKLKPRGATAGHVDGHSKTESNDRNTSVSAGGNRLLAKPAIRVARDGAAAAEGGGSESTASGNNHEAAPAAPVTKQPSQPGESPATAPARKLPEEMTEQGERFVAVLESIPQLFTDPELLSQAIRNIMVSLQESPHFIEMVTDDDIQLMIRGMRDVLGYARIKKAESKASRAKKPNTKGLSQDDITELNELFGGIDLAGLN